MEKSQPLLYRMHTVSEMKAALKAKGVKGLVKYEEGGS
jgi:hypothetical protein